MSLFLTCHYFLHITDNFHIVYIFCKLFTYYAYICQRYAEYVNIMSKICRICSICPEYAEYVKNISKICRMSKIDQNMQIISKICQKYVQKFSEYVRICKHYLIQKNMKNMNSLINWLLNLINSNRGLIQVGVNVTVPGKKKPSASVPVAGPRAAAGARPVYKM